MTTDEGLNVEGNVAKTRMPFRVAAFFLGILFVAFGGYQLLCGLADWIDFGFAIFVALMIREWYFRGLIYRATWFTPGGREIATETFGKANGGVGYFLRQDGTIRSRYKFEYVPEDNVYGAAEFPLYYDRGGKPVPDVKERID